MNISFSKNTDIFRVSFVIISLLITINLQNIYASFFHNIGMLQYQHQFKRGETVSHTWQPVTVTLQKAINLKPDNASANFRLARLFTLMHNYKLAKDYAKNGLLILGRPRCYIQQQDFWRSVATPVEYIPTQLTPFDHPQSRWKFEPIYLSTAKIIFQKANDEGCVAQIFADHDLAPNHFVWLWHDIRVKPNTPYLLSALVRSNGIEIAWLGIKSKWGGTSIIANQGWQIVSYNFHTQAAQTLETVQFVIEAGHGTLEIGNITLELSS